MIAPIDISMPLSADIPLWPGSPGVRVTTLKSIERGDRVNASDLAMDVHCGTHVDAPNHTVPGGAPMSGVPLEALIGPAVVIDLRQAGQITRTDLERAAPAEAMERILLRTRHSAKSDESAFDEDYCALAPDAAEWISETGVKLVGIDYLSIESFGGDGAVHDVLLRAGVVVLEGLDLAEVSPGRYRLVCLPLSLPSLEAAPARAVLFPGVADA